MGGEGAVVLAVETSCDETAVAILRGRGELLASEIASQAALHGLTGGVVPEVASREHLTQLQPLLALALDRAGLSLEQVDAFAATAGPGLATSLMLGMSVAKGLAVGARRPFHAINHLEGHLLSPFFQQPNGVEPAIALIVSGGHTALVDVRRFGEYRVLGQTRDDAAGEAFDKVAKLIGLGYPGGPEIDRLARGANEKRFDLPRSMRHAEGWEFSFSGLKTAVRYLLPQVPANATADLCASFQEAVVDVLVEKTMKAAAAFDRKVIAVSGGVSCNSRLRERFAAACEERGLRLLLAEPRFCTDNAVMIAHVAALKVATGAESSLASDIHPNLQLTPTSC